jgi:hypothetical protein
MRRGARKRRHSTHKIILGDSLKKKWKIITLYGLRIRSLDRQLISEDKFLWLSKEDLKGDTERSGIGNKNIANRNR